ncbi:MAG: hypothetical protein IH840_01455 [Candidatus Heimdallarchaeota archaeon]|nr:hypothetical protein [Candidatus Heimdallarchaeota archaeon]
MADQPELLLRKTITEEYQDLKTVHITLDDLQEALRGWPGVWWNAYSQKYGVQVKLFPYEARNGFFIDIDKRMATHRFTSKGIMRRDQLFDNPNYSKIVIPQYRETWFDLDDATRTYAILITSLVALEDPIPIHKFGLFNSWGKVSSNDHLHHPRLIKASWKHQ